jgi:DNA-binding response OmpR family regulator
MSIERHILLVEDDVNLAYVVRDNLEQAGYRVSHAPDGEAGWLFWETEHIDLCIFDVMLPKRDGFDLAAGIRQKNARVPILFLTARTQKEDRLHGFRIGGDDYLTKPFSIEELLLRIEVFLRRSVSDQVTTARHLDIGKYVFEPENLLLTLATHSRKLTRREADVLAHFCAHPNEICKREDILLSIWGDDDYFLGRSLDVFVSRLRKFLQEDTNITLENIHGIGFRLRIA